MGKRGNKSDDNGQGTFDINKTKDVRDSSGGRHSDQDRGDQNRRDDQDEQE